MTYVTHEVPHTTPLPNPENRYEITDKMTEENIATSFEQVEIDTSKLNPLSPEVISKQVRELSIKLGDDAHVVKLPQATINLG